MNAFPSQIHALVKVECEVLSTHAEQQDEKERGLKVNINIESRVDGKWLNDKCFVIAFHVIGFLFDKLFSSFSSFIVN